MKTSRKCFLGKLLAVAVMIVGSTLMVVPTATAATQSAKPPKPNIDLCLHDAIRSGQLVFPGYTGGVTCI
ncbi:hypothetical protein [Streptomyces avermitilis]|uniref:hypothetical protein n=2 Tax=Streptomyces TaxID=1883 RepID=UPI0036AD5588